MWTYTAGTRERGAQRSAADLESWLPMPVGELALAELVPVPPPKGGWHWHEHVRVFESKPHATGMRLAPAHRKLTATVLTGTVLRPSS